MTDYNAPIKDMKFVLEELCDLDNLNSFPAFSEVNEELVGQILNESARFTNEVISPLNQLGDKQASKLTNGSVKTPDGFKEAYSQFIEGGWNGTPFSPEYGGMGLPWTITTALMEMWQSANLAWSLCPLLTVGAIEAVKAHGTPELQSTYLPKLVSGEWTGTMNLTEPQAGSDLSNISTKAIKKDGQYFKSPLL